MIRPGLRVACLLVVATPVAAQPSPVRATQPPAKAAAAEPWRIIVPPQATLVFARDGALLGELGTEKRLSVPIRSLPKYVGQAFVAVEDKRFYQHDGVDLVGVASAIKGKLLGERRGGASTITQQLVGNMHPELIDRRDVSIDRKLREQSAAREMERHYTKEQILEAYINQINLGRGWHGVELAARHWFGKPAAQLTLHEAASLAAMPKSPSGYDPARYAAKHKQRRDLILSLMAEQGFISAAQATAAQRQPVTVAGPSAVANSAPWVLDIVKVQAERAGVPIAGGGYRVTTTIDGVLQAAAVEAVATGVAEIESRPTWRHAKCARAAGDTTRAAPDPAKCLQGLVVALDPMTGDVRALVGGRDYRLSSFDRAVDGMRQPGSSFKPFVYASAIANGLTANAMVADTAITIRMENGRDYAPGNADNAFLGALTMREALARSRNPVAVQLIQQVGIDTVASLARRAGIRSSIAPYPSSALGASVVQPLDFIAAYAAFDNGGFAVEPRFLLKIEDRTSKVVYTGRAPSLQPALDPRVAFVVRDMLRDAVERGTATAVRRTLSSRVPAAGKTGTTNDNSDVWFVGMTPDLVAGVWLGFDKPATIAAGAAGGTLAAPIFARVAQAWAGSRSYAEWTPPPGVVSAMLDRTTGEPATESTPIERRYTEWFLEGTEPGARRGWPWSLFKLGPIGF
ncbi:MAG: PBP1A family penicillin-binding protein [Gemmatimonadaceae bacterium]|jgi:penicillin-binding protein 1A|nr:PBP1A family penicillin-binding protein [Gemmatimonadaceae bacterium]